MKSEASSEEKLLNLIRKKNPGDKKENKSKDSSGAAVSLRDSEEHLDWPQAFMRLSLLLCMACLLYIGSHMFFFKEPRDAMTLTPSDASEEPAMEVQALPAPKPFSEYAQVLDQRDIFESPFQRSQKTGSQTVLPGQETLGAAPSFDLAQNFKVVGIILDKDPKAVIEDVRNQRTLFLSYGDHLEGGTLEEIRDGKVIFLFNDQRVELVP